MSSQPSVMTSPAAQADPFAAEVDAITARRSLYGLDEDLAKLPPCGLALSGGGIRSATFSLGLLRGLSALGLLQRIDYLSTVSGGGYTGAFYCGLFAKRDSQAPVIKTAPDNEQPRKTEDLLGQSGSQKALAYLRQSGRYLTPGGGRDYIFAVTILARNWLALTLVVGMAIIAVEMLLDLVRFGLIQHMGLIPPLGRLTQYYRNWYFVSPLALLLPPLAIVAFALGWAYWLTISDVNFANADKAWGIRRLLRPPLVGSIVTSAFSLAAACGRVPTFEGLRTQLISSLLAAVSLLALLCLIGASALETRWKAKARSHERAIQQDRIRYRLAQWQAGVALALFTVTLLALGDSASYLLGWLLGWFGEHSPIANLALPSLMAVLVPAGKSLVERLATIPQHAGGADGAVSSPGLLTRFGPMLAGLAALFFALAALSFWGGLAHDMVWAATTGHDAFRLNGHMWWALSGALLFVLLASFTYGFVNLSSLATFYADRLCRAYLGAGNPARLGLSTTAHGKTAMRSVRLSTTGDDIGLEQYYTEAAGAPVHLINVTINETHGKGPATVQRDRHGLNMVISPAGMAWSETAGEPVDLKPFGSSAVQRSGFTSPAGQSLPVSAWIGISGAAFTTGLGSATSLAKSTLAFLANVRLGYWWRAIRGQRLPGWTYARLFSEMIASFPGTTARQWYLSDGGHFENTAVYELVRRELPFIVLTDNGCDPHYGFEDIANLVRKCRIDFGADISFLGKGDLDTLFAASPQDLRQLFAAPAGFAAPDQAPRAVAMLAHILYANGRQGSLLVVKPRLSDDGPADLMRYKADNRDFPQQTTLDQFFDEAQWESYYELGRLMARSLFRPRTGQSWQPASLTSIPVGAP